MSFFFFFLLNTFLKYLNIKIYLVKNVPHSAPEVSRSGQFRMEIVCPTGAPVRKDPSIFLGIGCCRGYALFGGSGRCLPTKPRDIAAWWVSRGSSSLGGGGAGGGTGLRDRRRSQTPLCQGRALGIRCGDRGLRGWLLKSADPRLL